MFTLYRIFSFEPVMDFALKKQNPTFAVHLFYSSKTNYLDKSARKNGQILLY